MKTWVNITVTSSELLHNCFHKLSNTFSWFYVRNGLFHFFEWGKKDIIEAFKDKAQKHIPFVPIDPETGSSQCHSSPPLPPPHTCTHLQLRSTTGPRPEPLSYTQSTQPGLPAPHPTPYSWNTLMTQLFLASSQTLTQLKNSTTWSLTSLSAVEKNCLKLNVSKRKINSFSGSPQPTYLNITTNKTVQTADHFTYCGLTI